MTLTLTHTDALQSASRTRQLAERELRRSQLEREQAARALEFDLRPLTIDEAGRARLRATYADAAAAVDTNQRAFDRAVAIEQAARVLAEALEDGTEPETEVADGLLQLLEQRSRSRSRETVPLAGRSRRPAPETRTAQL